MQGKTEDALSMCAGGVFRHGLNLIATNERPACLQIHIAVGIVSTTASRFTTSIHNNISSHNSIPYYQRHQLKIMAAEF
jgi:hypothetical protein